jgi:hypothetical protein
MSVRVTYQYDLGSQRRHLLVHRDMTGKRP